MSKPNGPTVPAPNGKNPFFGAISDSPWIALTGSPPIERRYIDGYIEAAITLVTTVIGQRRYGSRDTLVMPVLFAARHALELTLKFTIRRLRTVGAMTSSYAKDHRILSHWEQLDTAAIGDQRIRASVSALQPYVRSLHRVDDDGQGFRYAETTSAQPSLPNLERVDLARVRTELETMHTLMNRLIDRVLCFEEERRTKTYTSECSRRDLREIASMLPKHEDWSKPEFLKAREEVMAKYGIPSRRKFSAAVNKIRESRQLAAVVGLEGDLKYVKDEHVVFAMQQYSDLERADLGGRFVNASEKEDLERGVEAVCERERRSRLVLDKLECEEVADIDTLYYLGKCRLFGEDYDDLVNTTVKEYRARNDAAIGLNHLMSKSDLLECVACGCRWAGRPSLATEVLALRPTKRGG